MKPAQSWGRFPHLEPGDQEEIPLTWQPTELPSLSGGRPLLPYGLGRSYGDSCLNPGGALLRTEGLDRFIDFDPESGRLRAEAGVTLDAILARVVPAGWFLPVTPGTRFVTLGGAIANDVHGKNHHVAGTLGRHVLQLGLLRSDEGLITCSPSERAERFAATVGGLGLTGLILWAEIQLTRIESPEVIQETVPFGGLEEFLAINRESVTDWPFTVAWVDCVSGGDRLGRGLYFRGRPAPADPSRRVRAVPRPPRLRVPFQLPSPTLNRFSVRAFNAAYRAMNLTGPRTRRVHYEPYFYPLDGVADWNRIYGPKGLLQFQCVVPEADGGRVMHTLLDRIARSGQASFLTVLKSFGALKSPGLLSFPRPGLTLALDLRHRGESTLSLFRELEDVAREAGGALYPAKDACMTPATFEASYPELPTFKRHVDPALSSGFWRRMTGDAAGAK